MKRMTVWLRTLALLLMLALLTGCAFTPMPSATLNDTAAPSAVPAPIQTPIAAPDTTASPEPIADAKYVFVFVGDGMGLNQVAGTRYYELALKGESAKENTIWKSDSFDSFPQLGLIMTHNASSRTTDSAASATAMFSGYKTENTNINCNSETRETYTPLALTLHAAQYKVGVISTCPINHATPAAMYASVDYRYDYDEIAKQGIESGTLDFWAGGGFRGESESILQSALDAGFTVLQGNDAALSVEAGSEPLIAIAPISEYNPYMPYEIDRAADEANGDVKPSLADFTAAAVRRFEGSERFFIMVEAGRVDGACASYDSVAAFNDVMALDDAVAVALEFMEAHPEDTLIVVLADHETGSLRLSSPRGFNDLVGQKVSGERFTELMQPFYEAKSSFSDAMETVRLYFGEIDFSSSDYNALENAYEESVAGELTSEDIDPFTYRLCKLTGDYGSAEIVSSSHSSQPVPVYAKGRGAELFSGVYDNTAVYAKLMEAMGLRAAN